jgi:hypothetical protein
MSLVLRNEKGSQLTFNEMDNNLTYLEGLGQDKLTTSSFNEFTSSYTTGSFTGSFVGDGSGLTGVPSSSTFTVYRAALFDDGTFLTPTIYENTTGRTISWIVLSPGRYRGTIDGATVLQPKVMSMVQNTYSNNSGDLFAFTRYRGDNRVDITTQVYNTSTNTFVNTLVADGGSNWFQVEVRIYN